MAKKPSREDLEKYLIPYSDDIHDPFTYLNTTESRVEVFLPTYMTLEVYALEDNQTKTMTIGVRYKLTIRVDVTGLDDDALDFIRKEFGFRLSEEAVEVNKDKLKIVEEVRPKKKGEESDELEDTRPLHKFLKYSHKKVSQVFYNPDYSDCPFDRHRILMKFEMTSVQDNVTSRNFRFNCFRCPADKILPDQIKFRPECDRLPEFNIASNKTRIFLPFEKKDDSRVNMEVYRYFPVTTFSIMIYREPESMILMTSLPLLVLNLFTIATFGLTDATADYGGKLGILVTLVLALFAFLPTIRNSIPSVPYLTLLEKQIFIAVGVQAISLLEAVVSLLVQDEAALHTITIVFIVITCSITFLNIFVFAYYYISRKLEFRRYVNPAEIQEIDEQKLKTEAAREEEDRKIAERRPPKAKSKDFFKTFRLVFDNYGLKNSNHFKTHGEGLRSF